MQRPSESFDAIVVGSGISGGWAAKELAERGLRVLLLERGKNVQHQKDYPNARKGPWEYRYRAGRSRAVQGRAKTAAPRRSWLRSQGKRER